MENIKKISKKYNLNLIEKSIQNYDSHIERFISLENFKNKPFKNACVVVEEKDTISPELLKNISAIIISRCPNNKLNAKSLDKFLKYKKPLMLTHSSPREIIAVLEIYLLRKHAKKERIHGTMLSIYGEGVLIIGESGIGKSELALELVSRNHLFIGDDAINIVPLAGDVIARSPKVSRDFIEVRGIGIINARRFFGIKSFMKEHKIDLVVQLVELSKVKSSIERLGNKYKTKNLIGVKLPLIQIPLSAGKSISPIIEAAVAAYKNKKYDEYIAVDEFKERVAKNNQ